MEKNNNIKYSSLFNVILSRPGKIRPAAFLTEEVLFWTCRLITYQLRSTFGKTLLCVIISSSTRKTLDPVMQRSVVRREK